MAKPAAGCIAAGARYGLLVGEGDSSGSGGGTRKPNGDDCRVLGSENEDARLVLCEASAVTMRTCLNMLGIEAPMRL